MFAFNPSLGVVGPVCDDGVNWNVVSPNLLLSGGPSEDVWEKVQTFNCSTAEEPLLRIQRKWVHIPQDISSPSIFSSMCTGTGLIWKCALSN